MINSKLMDYAVCRLCYCWLSGWEQNLGEGAEGTTTGPCSGKSVLSTAQCSIKNRGAVIISFVTDKFTSIIDPL